MGAQRSQKIVLDAGALIGIERGTQKMTALLQQSLRSTVTFLVPAGALAQAWRDGVRQARLARFLKAPEAIVLPLSEAHARASALLCAMSHTRDIVDASVVIAAREHHCSVVTSDPDDLAALDPSLKLHAL